MSDIILDTIISAITENGNHDFEVRAKAIESLGRSIKKYDKVINRSKLIDKCYKLVISIIKSRALYVAKGIDKSFVQMLIKEDILSAKDENKLIQIDYNDIGHNYCNLLTDVRDAKSDSEVVIKVSDFVDSILAVINPDMMEEEAISGLNAHMIFVKNNVIEAMLYVIKDQIKVITKYAKDDCDDKDCDVNLLSDISWSVLTLLELYYCVGYTNQKTKVLSLRYIESQINSSLNGCKVDIFFDLIAHEIFCEDEILSPEYDLSVEMSSEDIKELIKSIIVIVDYIDIMYSSSKVNFEELFNIK